MNTTFHALDKVKALYITELALGSIKYLIDHMDQNIANEHTTVGNVTAEMLALFLTQITDEEDFNEVLGSFLELVLSKVKLYKMVLKERPHEE